METATPAVVTENPQIETASEDGRVIAGLPGLVHPGELPIEYSRRPLPFAARFQAILIVGHIRHVSADPAAMEQAALSDRAPLPGGGRLPPDRFRQHPAATGFVKSMGLLLLTWGIVAVLIVVAVQITPS